jgi:hypothetical protein
MCDELSRNPPAEVRRRLRAEVGFGCPVTGCDNPYLQYHHFDPPWHTRRHHDLQGMIALCAEHHAKADAGAFTTEQLRKMKSQPTRPIQGRFDWLRNRVVSIIGGNAYYENPIALRVKGHNLVV